MNHVIWIDPSHVVDSYGSFRPETHSGVAVGGDWDLRTYPVKSNPIAEAAIRHWRDGLSWEETGAYDIQLERIRKYGEDGADGQTTIEDVVGRYARLDRLYDTVREEGRLRQHSGKDGVYIHIARDGRPVFGQRGVHRFVIAQLLEVPVIPAHLGVYYPGTESVVFAKEVPLPVHHVTGGTLKRR